MTDSRFSYDTFFKLCEKAFKRHGDILDLPRLKSAYHYIRQSVQQNYSEGKVLDFGCGANKPLQKIIGISDERYYSCDDDPQGDFTFRTVEQIPEDLKFNVITSNHVFEHLRFKQGIEISQKMIRHLAPGGIFLLGVPNPKHPTRYLSSPVHVTPWNYLNICALMELGGIDPFLCARTHKRKPPIWFMRPYY